MKEKLQEAIDLYKNGMPMLSVCKTTAVAFSTLQAKLKKLGLSRSNKENLKRHTPEALEKAIQLFCDGRNINEINKITKVSKYTLRKTFSDPNLILKNRNNKPSIPPIPSLLQAIELYKIGTPILTACEQTGACICTLQKWLKKLKLTRSNKQNSRKYHVNHNYFNTIDSEHKAYWLGFLYADGYVSNHKGGGKYVGCSLHEKDKEHLESFHKAIEATYPIKKYINNSFNTKSPYVRLLMSSDQMFDALVNKGVLEHKSLILKFPTKNQVQKHLINHFIRGYFDGDGSFAKNKTDGYYSFKICGTKEFLTTLGKHIGHSKPRLYKRYKNKNNNYYISIGGRLQVLAIGNYMYENANIWMERKHRRYLNL